MCVCLSHKHLPRNQLTNQQTSVVAYVCRVSLYPLSVYSAALVLWPTRLRFVRRYPVPKPSQYRRAQDMQSFEIAVGYRLQNAPESPIS